MEKPILNNSEIFPSDEVLSEALKNTFSFYQEFTNEIKSDNLQLNTEWNFYKDGKSWLCKITNKKKTVCWLSVWDSYFKLGFYFNEKNHKGVLDLEISDDIKNSFISSPKIGKLLPLTFEVKDNSQFEDLFKIIKYKKSCK